MLTDEALRAKPLVSSGRVPAARPGILGKPVRSVPDELADIATPFAVPTLDEDTSQRLATTYEIIETAEIQALVIALLVSTTLSP